jgi:hypothetical protein
MQGEQENELVEAYECELVDVGCAKSSSGLEVLLRFYPAGGTKHIAFALPPEEAEELALNVLARVRNITRPAKLN